MERTTGTTSTDSTRTQRPTRSNAEREIMGIVEGCSNAFRAGDLDKLMSYYAKDVVAYDMPPPLAYNGVNEYRKSWKMAMDGMLNPGPLDTAEEKFFISGDLAVFHCLCHMTGTLKKNNQPIDSWTRYTGVFKKFDNRWLIVHEQFSVPIDMESEKAVWDLKPGEKAAVH